MASIKPGDRFGLLTAIEPVENIGRHNERWSVRCECGTLKLARKGNLLGGSAKSCGCTRYGQVQPGRVFHKLTVIKETGESKYNNRVWECRCECGSVTNVTTECLVRGKTKSCGCNLPKALTPGTKFGCLTVLELKAGLSSNRNRVYITQCECGSVKEYTGNELSRKPNRVCRCASYKPPIEQGMVFGRLTVVEDTGEVKHTFRVWKCICSCGNIVKVTSRQLNSGGTKSCGCYRDDKLREMSTTHGMKGTRLYEIWRNMKDRCNNPNHISYKYYGGKGITYHPSFETFEGFLAGIPEGYSDDLTIDRINSDGNYEPGNLRWATMKEQANNRSNNRMVRDPLTGDIVTVSELADRHELNPATLLDRINAGLVGEDLIRPVKK